MKISILSLLIIIAILTSCSKNDEITPCVKYINIEEIFNVNSCCTYFFINNNDTISLNLINIDEGRAFGGACSVSTGGNAIIQLATTSNSIVEFNWRGCDADTEYTIDNPTLPTVNLGAFQLKMMKMYPLSKDLDTPPSSLDEYELKFVII